MSTYEWLLFLHVSAAFALFAALVLLSALIATTWRIAHPGTALVLFRLALVGEVLLTLGVIGTVVFGIWLAIHVDGYEFWDGWIIGALALWAVGAETARRAGNEYHKARDLARELVAAGNDAPSGELLARFRTRRGLLLHSAGAAAFVSVLALMIFKPGGA